MEGHFPLKMKRKDIEDVSDDFSDFSLSSPATKIRRLDVDLPPIIEEEEELQVPLTVEQSWPEEQGLISSNQSGGLRIEELPSVPGNEERAIVLFNPNSANPLLHSPSNFSVSVNPDLIAGLKNHGLWSIQSNSWGLANNDEATAEDCRTSSGNGCRAVVPWVAPQLPAQVDNCEMMDVEEVGEATMDVEDSEKNVYEADSISLGESLHQWQQQHCLIPQPPHNTATPIFWNR